MTYAELSASQAKRSVRFSEAQTEVMATYCDAEHDLKELQAENTKLQELTKEMFYSLLNVAGGRRIMTAGEAQNLMGRMSALGVEVDE